MKTLLFIFFAAITLLGNAATILVTNTNDSGAGSLRQAVADANMGDIIRFDATLLAGGSDTILLSTPVLIDKGLFFNGLYNATDTLFLSGGNSSTIFHIRVPNGVSYPHIDIDSLVFIDGAGGTYGGAILLDNQLFYNEPFNFYIRNCVFRDNTAPYGGAIGSYRSEASTAYGQKVDWEIYNSTFKNNSASGAGSDGGAIYLYRKRTGATNDEPRLDVLIHGCNFLANESQDQGGAIYMYAESYQGDEQGLAYLTITESTFNLNHTTNAGGAIYMMTTDSYAQRVSVSKLDVTTSTFTNNSVVTNGGAIYVQSFNQAIVYVRSCTLMNNTALNDGSAIYLKGGTVDNLAEVRLSSSILMSNGGNVNYNNTLYQDCPNTDFYTDETNICDCVENDWVHYNDLFDEDLFGKTLAEVNLLPLALNSKNTYTMVPAAGSIAIGASNSIATYEAQNRPVLGVRDIGAAESDICEPIPVSETASFCQGSSYSFYDQTLTAAGTYSHTIQTPNECDTVVTLTLNETSPVTPTISISANPGNTIMTGTTVTITAAVSNGGSSPSFQWYADGFPIGPDAISVITSTLYDGVEVSCVLTSNHECVSPATALSDTITFTVHANNDEPCNAIPLDVNSSCVTEYFANHIATETTNVGPHSCASSTSKDIWFTFTAPASGNVDIYTYAGTLVDAVMSVYLGPTCSSLFEAGCVDDDGGNQMPQGMVTGGTAGTTYFIRVSSFGATASGNFGICVVDQGSSPVITSNDADNNLCEGGSLTLTSDAASGNVWSTGETSQSITVNTSGTYSVTVDGLLSNEIIVTTTTINATATDGGSGILTAGEAAGGGVTYQWVDCNNGNAAIAGATSRDFSPVADGSYAVIITKNGCTEMSSCLTFDIVSVTEMSGLNAFSIHPNPASSDFTLSFKTQKQRSISIYSAEGNKVLEVLSDEISQVVSLGTIAPGIYYVEVEEDQAKSVKKLIRM